MPRDQRLYMTFPNDFPWHPKVQRLSPAVKWAFVEMNGYSRMNDLDGVIPAGDAEFMWKPAILTALTNSHPLRPLVVRAGDTYVIRDYAEHQQTKAERDDLHAKRAAAGAKGGQARAKQLLSKTEQSQAESESRVQSSETTYLSESSHVSNRAREADDDEIRREGVVRATLREGFRIDPDRLIEHISQRTNRKVTVGQAMGVASMLLDKGKDVKSPQAYVFKSITDSWAEVQQYIDTEGTP